MDPTEPQDALPRVIAQWLDTYNENDLPAHMALYTDDASIVIPGSNGNDVDLNPDGTKSVFEQMEHALDAAAPKRQIRFDWVAVSGPKVAVEATLMLDPGDPATHQPLVVHFTLSADGSRTVRNRTYVNSTLQAGLGGA